MVGRRTRFGFNKVTAVSTTGFAAGAVEFANDQGIELRTINILSKEELFPWLKMTTFWMTNSVAELHWTSVLLDELNPEHQKAVQVALTIPDNTALLLSSRTNMVISPVDAFLAIVKEQKLVEELKPNEPDKEKDIKLQVRYINDDDHIVIKTVIGLIRIPLIYFSGKIKTTGSWVPLFQAQEYRNLSNEQSISQVAVFKLPGSNLAPYSFEIYKISESSKTHIVLRKE